MLCVFSFKVKQPIFGANYLTGFVMAEHGGMILFILKDELDFAVK